ncbi:LEA domain-containing protein [Schizosaccharomyces japonicus yFS275]|uniref:LEA domain-containing protein n=1 Tax=Schizosaccharomyces japonicus (strain yFS275 / FY16936) TaxID=402676 RepID=B6JWA6_SCHJY|nr:LEA domain-containing protein [Schizosaccharomyces japonicus yFS275]EEB05657.1 LEA domain-containing protein [Schizosaccharomyces japonicus yFS275]
MQLKTPLLLLFSFSQLLVSRAEEKTLTADPIVTITNTKVVSIQTVVVTELPELSHVSDSWPQKKIDKFLEKNIVEPVEDLRQNLKRRTQKYWSKKEKDGRSEEELREQADEREEELERLYSSWSKSELVNWLIQHNYKIPEPGTYEQLLQTVMHASRTLVATGPESYNEWSTIGLTDLLHRRGVRIPKGATHRELVELAKRYVPPNDAEPDEAKPVSVKKVEKEKEEDVDSKPYVDCLFYHWYDGRLLAFLRSRGQATSALMPREKLLEAVYETRFDPRAPIASNVLDGWSTADIAQWLSKYAPSLIQPGENIKADRNIALNVAKMYYSTVLDEHDYQTLVVLNDTLLSHAGLSTIDSWSDDELLEELEAFGELVPIPFDKANAYKRLLPHWRFFMYGPSVKDHMKYWAKKLTKIIRDSSVFA